MYSWEIYHTYCQQHPRWFETLTAHQPTGEHLAAYRDLMGPGWDLRRRGVWLVAAPPKEGTPPAQGWKLHVSARSGHSESTLRRALPVLRDAEVPFKFLADPWSVALTNGKLWPRTSSGKFITVYPADEDLFRQVAGALTAALRDTSGPYILSDRRCPGSTTVYYRYGGFVGVSEIRADGAANLMITAPDGTRYADLRQPFWSAPPWLSADPFGQPVQDPDEDEDAEQDPDGLLHGRFRIESALQFSNRGGVYRALDTRTGRPIILKEARPHVGFGSGSESCVEMLRKEYRLLNVLAGTGHFVAPVDMFEAWEHTFLAEEFVDGAQLSQLSIAANPLYTLELTGTALAAYHDRMRGMLSQLAEAIAAAHRAGVVLGDLSWTNVLVEDGTDRVVLIDVEGSTQRGVDGQLGLYTKGVSSPRFIHSGVCEPADDYYALGAMLFGSVALLNSFVGYRPDALPTVLDEVAGDLGVPAELVALIRDLTAATPSTVDIASVPARLAALPVGEPGAWPTVIPLSRPASGDMTGPRLERLRRRVDETLEGVGRYLRGTASPERDDRLFPADLGVYETNPLNVAYGAGGVLYAMNRLPGEIPGAYLGWLLRHEVRPEAYPPGLYFGMAGIAWVLADLGQLSYASRLLRLAADHPLALRRPDVLHGAAGLGLAALRFWQLTGDREFLDVATTVGAHLAATVRRDRRGAYWSVPPDPLSGDPNGPSIPLGYAYGPAGIALFLLYLSQATGDPDALALGRAALDFELAHATPISDRAVAFPAYADHDERILRSYWDQGTAGVLSTLVRYLHATGDEALRGWLNRLLPDVCRKYAVFPQQFHGLAGLGNAVLDAAEFTGEEALFAEAWRVAEGVLLFRIDAPEGITFPGEQALRESADFATGAAGVALFLHRLRTAAPGTRTNANFTLDGLLTPAVPR